MKTIALIFTFFLLGVSFAYAQSNYTEYSERQWGLGINLGPVFEPYPTASGDSFFWGVYAQTEKHWTSKLGWYLSYGKGTTAHKATGSGVRWKTTEDISFGPTLKILKNVRLGAIPGIGSVI